MTAARVSPRVLAILLTLAAASWATVILLMPLAHAALPIAARAVDVTAALVCHQRDDRSFHLHGQRLVVCGRCTGLYLAGAVGAWAAWFGRARVPVRTRRLVLLAALPTAATFAAEWIGAANPGNVPRAAAALPLGAVLGWLFVRLLRVEEQPETCAIIT